MNGSPDNILHRDNLDHLEDIHEEPVACGELDHGESLLSTKVLELVKLNVPITGK